MENKKVLFVAHVDSHIEAFHLPYLKMFKEQGYEVHVASNGDSVFANCDVKYNIPFQRSPLDFKNYKAYVKLKKILNINSFDIIHCHTPVGGAIARIANKHSKFYSSTKMIYTAHGFHFFKGNNVVKNFIFRSIEKYCAKYTDILITINNEDYIASKKFKLKTNGNFAYVPGVGIDVAKYDLADFDPITYREKFGFTRDDFIVLSVGEVNRNKNHIVIIKSLKMLNNPQIQYVIAGTGESEQDLKLFVKENGLERCVHFLGFRNDISELNRMSDIFAFPSKREGLGLAALEAMASGLPIITSNVRGINDYSIDGVTGFSYTPNNYEGFASGITYFMKNRDEKIKIGLKNKELVSKYDRKKVIVEMKKLYFDSSEH